MSGRPESPWLDRLARRSVAREPRAQPVLAPRYGLSRRALVRVTGVAMLAGGAMRMVKPTIAFGQDSAACIRERTKENQAQLAECLRGPQDDYKGFYQAYLDASAALKANPKGRARKNVERQISNAINGMLSASNAMTNCNGAFSKAQNDSQFNCQVIGPPQPPQPGDTPGQMPAEVGSGGCPGETFLCGDGRCCYTGTFCCSCACCVYRDCRCCVGA